MFAKVHPPTDIKGGNKGSCYDLATYLNKEQGTGQNFFSHTEDNVTVEDVIININNNKKAIGKDEAKFYMVSLNPSEAEQRHLIGRNVSDVSELSEAERQTVFRKLEAFTRSAMNEYAKNFERDNIRSGADLMYYGRIETQRIYKPEDEEVKSGAARIGEVKSGLNFHVHVIVSRKSLDGKTKLAPAFGKSAGNAWELEGRGTVKRGFSHEKFKVSVQNSFNREFDYQSTKEETYTIKKTPEQTIINKISNPDLKQLLTDTHFTAANQIVSAMKEKGYDPQDSQKKVAQEKVLKYVEYEVIYDSHTKTTVPVSEIRKFARENDINLYDRFKHSYAVSNPDLRECLSNPDLTTRRQINQEMRKRGYTVSTDEKGNYTYTKNGASFSMSRRDLGAFTNYVKDSANKQSSHSSGSGRGEATAGAALNMTVGNVKSKVTNEILGDSFKTERQIIGKVKTAVTVVTNPASIKMMLLRKIASYLNPLKEM